jgi:hypothetical protein
MADYQPTMNELGEQVANVKAMVAKLPPSIKETLQDLVDALDKLESAARKKIDKQPPEGRG